MGKIPKFAVLSHVLPPLPSGQAVILYRLLKNFDKNQYCLISTKDYQIDDKHLSTEKLSAKCYKSKPLLFLKGRVLFLDLFLVANQIKKILIKEKCRVLICATGGFLDMPAAYLACKWAKVEFIPYIFDDYVYQWTGFHRKLAAWMMPRIAKKAIAMVVPNEFIQKDYEKLYHIKCKLIHNSQTPIDLKKIDQAKPIFDKKEINIVYTGMVYHANYDAFFNLIEAVGRINKINGKKLIIHIYSLQSAQDLAEIGIKGKNVLVHEHVPQSEIHTVQRQADILFLPLGFKTPIAEVIRTSEPAKMAEYQAIGRPILVHVPRDTYIKWYFEKNKCGIVVSQNDSKILAKEIVRLVKNPQLQKSISKQALIMAEGDFSLDVSRARFIQLLESLN